MGGLGSGRSKQRNHIDGLQTIRGNILKPPLLPGSSFLISWRAGGKKTNLIEVKVKQDLIVLRYDLKTCHPPQPVELPVWLERKVCFYGGERIYFSCPRCRKRAFKLYLSGIHFICRTCVNLPYESQSLSEEDRLLNRYHKYGRKISSSFHPMQGLPDRPKGMHDVTYLHLLEQAHQALIKRKPLSDAWFRKMSKALGKKGFVESAHSSTKPL